MNERIPRGVLPTYLTDRELVLCKAAPTVHNTYEIRLALFMALDSGRKFELIVAPTAVVDAALAQHIAKFGGAITRGLTPVHSVYVVAVDANGAELEGWVAGDNEAWLPVLRSIRSEWLRSRLSVGATVLRDELEAFKKSVSAEKLHAKNIDEEDLRSALLLLVDKAAASGGYLLVV